MKTLIDLNGGYFLLNEDMPSERVETVVKRLSVQAEEERRSLSELLEDSSQSKLRFKKISDPELMNAYLKAFRTTKIVGTLIAAEERTCEDRTADTGRDQCRTRETRSIHRGQAY